MGYFDGRMQLFQNGQVRTLREGVQVAPVRMGDVVLASADAPDAARMEMNSPTLYMLGLEARAEYGIEIDDRELELGRSDAGGTLVIRVPSGVGSGVRVHRREAAGPPTVR